MGTWWNSLLVSTCWQMRWSVFTELQDTMGLWQCSALCIPGAVCVSVCSPKWVYVIESLCCSVGAVSLSTYLCCSYSLWMKSFLRLRVQVQVAATPRTTRKSLCTNPVFPMVSQQEGVIISHSKSSNQYELYLPYQEPGIKAQVLTYSIKCFNIRAGRPEKLQPFGSLRSVKKAMRDKTLYFFLFFSTILNHLIEYVSSWALMLGSWHARGFVTCFYSNWKKYPSVAISFFSKLNRFLGGRNCKHMKRNKIVSIKLNSFSSAFEETITEECCGGALESELTYLQSWFK